VILMMFVLWLIHLGIGNASIVDPGWALGLPLLAVTYAVLGFQRRHATFSATCANACRVRCTSLPDTCFLMFKNETCLPCPRG
jgi:hypothetical protein